MSSLLMFYVYGLGYFRRPQNKTKHAVSLCKLYISTNLMMDWHGRLPTCKNARRYVFIRIKKWHWKYREFT